MKEMPKNIPASILARLRNQAEIIERPYAEVLQYFVMERFLYRLSKTKYAEKFVLKGGLLFYAWNLSMRRPTRDIDFRGYVSNDSENLHKIIRTVIEVSAPEDGLVFDMQSISVEETQVDADYVGIRVKLIALLERTRIPLQIDIGFSDELASKAELVEYPNILPDFKSTQMRSYPKEAVVAEKFHAMVQHAQLNSRMKDYYDLWLILQTFNFESSSLQKAIEITFKKRDETLPTELPIGLTAEFGESNQSSWESFLEKSSLGFDEISDFVQVIEKIWGFLQHPLLASTNGEWSSRKWHASKGWK